MVQCPLSFLNICWLCLLFDVCPHSCLRIYCVLAKSSLSFCQVFRHLSVRHQTLHWRPKTPPTISWFDSIHRDTNEKFLLSSIRLTNQKVQHPKAKPQELASSEYMATLAHELMVPMSLGLDRVTSFFFVLFSRTPGFSRWPGCGFIECPLPSEGCQMNRIVCACLLAWEKERPLA